MGLRDQNKSLTVTDDKGTQRLSGTLQRAATGTIAKPTGRALDAVMKAAAKGSSPTGNGRIGFVIDATGSRSESWKETQEIQASMFSSVAKFGSMQLRLVHFGGDEVTDHGWIKDTMKVTSAMSQVECICGSAQTLEGLRRFLDDDPSARAQSIVVVGDSFEENFDEIEPVAELLKAQKIKVFTFLDDSNGSYQTEEAFKMLAEKTGGAFASFGKDMALKDLCECVAVMSSGGANALQQLKSSAAKTLLLGVKPT